MERTLSTEIMTALMQNAPEQRRQNLERLQQACDALAKTDDISLKNIENFVRLRFGDDSGPRAQSISNERKKSPGMHSYVLARQREVREKAGARRPRTLSEMIEMIGDMDVRNAMRDLADRCAAAEASLGKAKSVLKTLRPGVNVDDLLLGRPVNNQGLQLDQEMVEAITRLHRVLTDDLALMACGLTYDSGRVRRRTGTHDQLFDASTLGLLSELVQKISKL